MILCAWGVNYVLQFSEEMTTLVFTLHSPPLAKGTRANVNIKEPYLNKSNR